MLADSKLPTTFWAKVVNISCYVQNWVLVVKPYFKTPYEMFRGRLPALSFMRPFGCHVTILNTLDQLGKFDGKSDEEIFVGYSTISKAFIVYNTRTRKVEENLHITFFKNKPMITGSGPEWLFDIDALSESMNYAPVFAGTHSNDFAGKGASFDACQSSLEIGPIQDYILMPLWKYSSLFNSSSQDSNGHDKDKHGPSQESECDNQERTNAESNTKNVNTVGPSINAANTNDNLGSLNINTVSPPVNIATPTYADYPSDPLLLDLEDTGIFDDAYDDRDEGAEANYNNLEIVILVSLILSTRAHKDHPKEQIIGEKSLITEFEQLMHKRFQMRSMRELTFFLGLQVEKQTDGIFLSQDKYVCDILKKFGFSSVKSASTPMETHKPLSKDIAGTDVDVYLYRSMIGSLMYLTSYRSYIMFDVCACSRFQVQIKVSHIHAVKRIFRYLKGQPTLGLWYPKDSPLELIAYSNSDYAGASLDRKSIIGGYQFLSGRLISWQCKKQTIVADSTTEAEYIAASNCRG
nr:hypothetical protein [Tanacetum cinerariifolium]